MKRILVWIGSRANYGRLKELIDILNAEYTVHLIFGDYDLPYLGKLGNNAKVIGKVPNLLYSDTRNNMARSVSLVTQSVTTIIESQEPYDLAIVHADRFENLGFAIACSYSGIPLLHTEGGEVSGQIDDKVRNAITSLSDYHCTTTAMAERRLHTQGYNAFNTGSPAIDYVKNIEDEFGKPPVGSFVLCLFNPSDEDSPEEFASAIEHISHCKHVYWVNPSNDPGWRKLAKWLHSIPGIYQLPKLSPKRYYAYLRRCQMLIGNTSSGIKEGGYLGVPYLMVGTRQSGREIGPNVIKCKCIERDIIMASNDILRVPGYRYEYNGMFGDGYAALQIADVIRNEVAS